MYLHGVSTSLYLPEDALIVRNICLPKINFVFYCETCTKSFIVMSWKIHVIDLAGTIDFEPHMSSYAYKSETYLV